MVNLQEIFEKSGLRSCLVIGAKIAEEYLLTEDEKRKIENVIPALLALPLEFTYGFAELKDTLKLGVVRIEDDNFIVFPTRSDNVGELCRELARGFAGGLVK